MTPFSWRRGTYRLAVTPLRIDVLGPLRVYDVDGRDVTPDGVLQRRLLALLVIHRGEVVTLDTAIDALWPIDPPSDPRAALQTHLFRLRRMLPRGAVESTASGYRLDSAAIDVDADRLAEAVRSAAMDADLVATIGAALDGWRGPAYPELADSDDGRLEAARLEDLRVRAVELCAEARLAEGVTDGLVVELAALVEEHPLRERPRELLIEALAATGRTADALRAYDDFRRLLSVELGIEPSPLLRARHDELLRGSVPSQWAPPTRLPLSATSIVGRADLIAAAASLAESSRLITLVGPGGVGKTRLLTEVGHRLRDHSPETPVVMCELDSATVDSAVDIVAAALTIDPRPGVAVVERVVGVLGATEVVILLDNCEHVLEPVAELAEQVLARCPRVTIWATSRERLRVAGEQLLPVAPLQAAGDDSAAARLFVERARAVAPDFEPSPADRALIRDIVQRLDGIPLAIELAAARLHTLDLTAVAAGLDRRFQLLAAGRRTATRHRSLIAAVSWSFELLAPELRHVFADLSVFAGSFTVADVAAVCGCDIDEAAIDLEQLTERSLVIRRPGQRYGLLETLRAYGAERLAADDRSALTMERHAYHQVAWAEAAESRMLDRCPLTAIAEIDAALPDLRAALAWLLDHGDVEAAGRLVTALFDYAFFRLRPDVLAWAEQVCAADPDDRSAVAPLVWRASAYAAWMAGDIEATGERTARAVETSKRGTGDLPVRLATACGSYALFEGRLADAAAWYRRGLDAVADPPARQFTAATLLLALGYAGDPSAGEVAEALLADVGDAPTPYAAYAHYCAGEADLSVDPARAKVRLARAVELAELTNASFVIGAAGASYASIEARCGDPLVAADEYRRVIAHWHRAGMWSTQWTTLRAAAALLARLGRVREAAVLAGAVLATSSGHRIFGDDEKALADLVQHLRGELGEQAFEAARAEGARLDGDAAVEHAVRSL
jgi:predicted ATPase/DNA-binding SARP family transcriptional activator